MRRFTAGPSVSSTYALLCTFTDGMTTNPLFADFEDTQEPSQNIFLHTPCWYVLEAIDIGEGKQLTNGQRE
jgi:hypothetical protein